MSLMSKLTAAYIAGFVDGEGYIGIIKDSRRITFRRTDSYEAVIKIANTNKAIIDWFLNSYGGQVDMRVFEGKSKDAYCWKLAGEKLIPFLDKVSPYLKIKRKQCEIVKALRNTYRPSSYTYIKRVTKNGGSFVSKTTKDSILKEREELYQKIRELNFRGKTLHAERLNNVTPEMVK
jgi:hypothetical protein